MDLQLNEDQRMIDQALARFVGQYYDYPARRQLVQSAPGFSHAHWQRFAEMGLLALPLAEEHGGLAADFSYTALLMEWIGKGLVAEPYLASVVLAGGVLRRCAGGQDERLTALGEGRLLLAFADDDAGAPTTVRECAGGYLVEGSKRLVLHGDSAGQFVISARDPQGQLVLLLADAGQAAISMRGYRMVDGLPACDLTLRELVLSPDRLLARGEQANAIRDEVLTDACAALCAEASGCMQVLFDTTLDYVRQRRQFGRAIGSFQVIQHRLADCFIELEQVKSMSLLATRSVAAASLDRRRIVAAAKAFIAEAGVRMGHAAIQLHGAMGMTEELAVGAYHKRLLAIATLFGGVEVQIDRFLGEAA